MKSGRKSFSIRWHWYIVTVIVIDKLDADVGVMHVTCMGEGRNVYRFLVGKSEGKILLRKPVVDRNTILKRILKEWYVKNTWWKLLTHCTATDDFFWVGVGVGEVKWHSGSGKCCVSLDWPKIRKVLKTDGNYCHYHQRRLRHHHPHHYGHHYHISYHILSCNIFHHVGRDSSVGTTTRYGLDGPGSNPGED